MKKKILVLLVGLLFLTGCGNKNNDVAGNVGEPKENTPEVNNNNNNPVEDSRGTKNSVDKSIQEIKAELYPNIYGLNGTNLTLPRSFIINNVISVNPSNNERFFAVEISNHIGKSENTLIQYIIDEDNVIDISFTIQEPRKLVVQSTVEGTDIYVYNTGNNNGPYLTGTRYIMLDFPDVIYAGGINKTYLTLKSTKEVSDEELYRISKNIVIDKTKGEYANDGKESSLVTDNSNLIFNFDKVIVNLSNTVITKWISYGDGAMGIAYYVNSNGNYVGILTRVPFTLSLSGLKDNMKESNELNAGSIKYELETFDVDGFTFYTRKFINIKTNDYYYEDLFTSIDNNRLMSFSKYGKVKTIDELKTIIRERIINKVLFKK